MADAPIYEPIENAHAFKRKVLDSDVPVVVDFWADWCQPCKMMAPVFDKIAREHGTKARFVKLNTEKLPEVAQACGIRSLPTIALYWQGRPRDVLVGLKTEAQLQKRVRWLINVSEGRGFLSRLFGNRREDGASADES